MNQVLTLRIGNGIVRDNFKAKNRELKSSSQDRSLESVMEEFETSSESWNREWKSSSEVLTLGIGNGIV